MRLDASQMLLGSTPIVFLIAPVVLAGAFTLQSSAALAAATDPSLVEDQYAGLAKVMTMLSSVVLVGIMILAGYYVEETQQRFKMEIDLGDWERDPQEQEVLELIRQDEEDGKVWEQITRWPSVPGHSSGAQPRRRRHPDAGGRGRDAARRLAGAIREEALVQQARLLRPGLVLPHGVLEPLL